MRDEVTEPLQPVTTASDHSPLAQEAEVLVVSLHKPLAIVLLREVVMIALSSQFKSSRIWWA
jgi:hypothetical protein